MNTATVIDTPEGIAMFHLLQMKYALKLECLGMKHSRGSVYALVKRELGFKGDKRSVLTQLEAHIKATKDANQLKAGAVVQSA